MSCLEVPEPCEMPICSSNSAMVKRRVSNEPKPELSPAVRLKSRLLEVRVADLFDAVKKPLCLHLLVCLIESEENAVIFRPYGH